jgi:hypothetical protein
VRYHHLGIPTSTPREGETYLELLKMYVTDHESNPYGIQWMRFDPDSRFPDLVKTTPHVAFQVDDLESAIAGRDVIIAPNSPSPGVTVAFVTCEGVPVELLQFDELSTQVRNAPQDLA